MNKKIIISGPAHSIHVQRWYEGVKKADPVNHYYLLDSSGKKNDKAELHILRWSPKINVLKPIAFIFNIFTVGLYLIYLRWFCKFDLVHCHWTGDVTSFLVALIWRQKQIQNPWGTDLLILPNRSFFHKLLLRATYSLTSKFMTDAKHVKEKLIKMSIDPSSISIIYFGTDINYFTPGKTDIKKKYGLDENTKIIYSNRSLYPVYDIETIVRSAKILPNYTFVISGGGPLEDELNQLTLKLSLTNVIFVGRIPFEDLRDFLRECDVYVSASKSDAGLAASIAEAMSCGAPVVCSDFGDNVEWVEKTCSGLVFEIGNEDQLAEKISLVTDSPEKYKGGRAKIENDNNSNIEMLKATEIYRKIIKA